jgi:hypothetical protein
VIVLGDLNDTPAAATTQMLYGPPGSQYGTGGFAHPDRAGTRHRSPETTDCQLTDPGLHSQRSQQ